MSYKQIAETMADMYDMSEPDKATIYHWVKTYTDTAVKEMEQHPAHTGGDWVADEMMVDVGGQKYWNWNVMDSTTRYILASHLSKERTAAAAKTVMGKALKSADATTQEHHHRQAPILPVGHQGSHAGHYPYQVRRNES